MSTFLLFTILNTSCLFLFMTHPLAMGLMLLIQTCLISALTGCMGPTFWFSYILFLVFLGGMLVLFIYMTSLASNEMFSLSYPMLACLPITFIGLMTTLTITYSLNWVAPLIPTTNTLHTLLEGYSLNTFVLNLYSTLTSHLTLLLASYLLLTLIIVVNLTSLNQGPLRTHGI